MKDALSKKLNFRVNGYSIILNGILIESALNKYNIKKLGFLGRLTIKPSSDENVFWAKNCDFNYIDDDYKNSIVPIMPTVKCDNCGHSVEVEDTTKRYRFPLFFIFLGLAILACENTVNNPSLIITILGGQSAIVGLIWLIVVRFVLVGTNL